MNLKTKQFTLFVLLLLVIYGIPNATAVYLDDTFLRLAEPAREFQFSSSTLYPGEIAYMNVSLTIDYWKDNTPPQELVIYWAGLRFDWMRENEWVQKDFSLNPYTLDPNDTADFPAFTGQVPSNVTVGNHTLTGTVGKVSFDGSTEETDWSTLDGGTPSIETTSDLLLAKEF